MIDIYHSRRTNYLDCEYWIRDERDSIANASKYVLNNKPSGIFHAKLVSDKTVTDNQISNVMMFDRNMITIETDDIVDKIQKNSIVRCSEELWIVENVQAIPHKKEMQFSKHIHYKYVLSLRR